MTNQNASSNHTNKPIEDVRLGAIRGAIWRNTDQQGRDRFNVTFERGYTDSNGDWQSSTSYGRDDLLTLAKVADLANTRIFEIQAESRRRAKESEAPSTPTKAAAKSRVASR